MNDFLAGRKPVADDTKANTDSKSADLSAAPLSASDAPIASSAKVERVSQSSLSPRSSESAMTAGSAAPASAPSASVVSSASKPVTYGDILALPKDAQEAAGEEFMKQMKAIDSEKYNELRQKAIAVAGNEELFELKPAIDQIKIMTYIRFDAFFKAIAPEYRFMIKADTGDCIQDHIAEQLTPSLLLNYPKQLKIEILELLKMFDYSKNKTYGVGTIGSVI